MADPEFTAWLEAEGYHNVRELPDGTIAATRDLLYTRALVIDLDRWGYAHRYCYEDRSLADQACLALTSGDDAPLSGFVAERHRGG